MQQTIDRPIIDAIVEQHLENAAFSWSRCNQDLWSTLATERTIKRYHERLLANLDGIRLAGSKAIPLSVKKLLRWKSIDELFVTLYLLLNQSSNETTNASLETCENLLSLHPELIEGAVSAWDYINNQHFTDNQRDILAKWWTSEKNAVRVVALSVLLNTPDINVSELIAIGSSDKSPEFRASIFKAIGELGLKTKIDYCVNGLNDPDNNCRFEAAFSLALLGDETGLTRLKSHIPLLNGDNLKKSLLVWATTVSELEFQHWLTSSSKNPNDSDLRLWAIGFRGEPIFLSTLHSLINEKNTPLAGYIFTHLTGIELDEQEAPQSNEHSDKRPSPSEYYGMPTPNLEKLLYLISQTPITGQNMCMGKPLTLENALLCISQGTQPQRWQASLFIAKFEGIMSWNAIRNRIYIPHTDY